MESETKTYISKKGYVLVKKYFSVDILINVKKDLTAIPLTGSDTFGTQIKSFPIYIETQNNLYIPKIYGLQKFLKPDKFLKNYYGDDIKEHPFNGQLHIAQIKAVDIMINSCHTKGGGILHLTAGSGKTVCAINIISKLKKKTIIVVNKISLMKQWEDEIKDFLPSCSIGIIQGSKNIHIENRDIIIVMLQSLSMIDYPESYFNDIGLVIFDECHNIASKIFSKILFKLTSQFTIGLSATPIRSDGCEHVFKYHIGDIEHSAKIERQGLPPIIHTIKLNSKEYLQESKTYFIKGVEKQVLQFTTMISHLVQMNSRNNLIKNTIIQCLQTSTPENPRKILVLSERRNHLFDLLDLLQKENLTYTYGLFLGSMKIKDLNNAKTCNVILATYKSFSEGVSEKNLDTLILITPKKFIYLDTNNNSTGLKDSGKMEQTVGRIFRKNHTVYNPLIIDFQDDFSVYKSHSYSRLIFYKQHFSNAQFVKHSVNIDSQDDFLLFSEKKIKEKKLKKNLDTNLIESFIMLD